jgi:heavy metal sensor kinase
MSATISLRRRLAASVVGILGLCLGAFSAILYITFGHALWKQFDARMAADALDIANMVEQTRKEPWEFEHGSLGEFERTQSPAYFEIWMTDGRVFARSPSLGAADLPLDRSRLVLSRPMQLPDGRAGRLYQATLSPRPDADDVIPNEVGHVIISVARDTREVASALTTLRLLLAGFGLAALVLAALAGLLAIQTGLRPLASLAARIDAIDARKLDERIEVLGLPVELAPPVAKLNELLARLGGAFDRERRFSADVSHELRTPLAGLRTILEVCASRERSADEYRSAISEALAVVGQMTGLAESLLLLARLDARQVDVRHESVPLRRLVEDCYAPFSDQAAARRLRFENRVPASANVSSDPEKLRIVVSNLISNAVTYTNEGGAIVVDHDAARGVILDVTDSGPPIPESALGRIFDRFFRADPSRARTGEHCGIGLALVRALSEVLGLRVSAENRNDGGVVFRLTSPL